MKQFGIQLLESNAGKILEKGGADVLIFLNANTTNDEVYAETMASMVSRGMREPLMRFLAECREKKRWDRIALCAKGIPRGDSLREYATRLLEENACDVIAACDNGASSLLFRNAESKRVGRIALDALLAENDPEAIRLMFKAKEAEKDWDGMAGECGDRPDLKGYALRILERNISHASGHGSPDCLVFIGTNTQNSEIRKKCIRALARGGNRQAAKTILDDAAGKELWKDLAEAAGEHEEIRRYVLGLMEKNLERIAESGDLDAMAFMYRNSNHDQIGRKLVEGLLRHGKENEACVFLDWIAGQGGWTAIMAESEFPGNPEGIRAHAYSLLVQNHRKVLRSGSTDVVEYLIRQSDDFKVLDACFEWSVSLNNENLAKSVLMRMSEKRMWNNLVGAVRRAGRYSRSHSYGRAILERNIHNVCSEAGAESIISLWKMTGSEEKRTEMLGTLSVSERTEETKKLLDSMARSGEVEWLEYFEYIAQMPDLREYTSSLIESHQESRGSQDSKGFWDRLRGIFAGS